MSPIVPQPRPALAATGGLRQRQQEFVDNGTLVGLNATVRPDALVLDPLTAYTTGPKALGDQSDGPTAWVWRARVVGLTVQLARENDTRTGWNADAMLFVFTGAAPSEIDVAFEQSSRAVVSMQRATGAGSAPEVWLYYFNAIALGYEFVSFGNGRTPRLILDNPQTPNSSDVLLAYLNPVADRLELRQQRDRYLTAYAGPLTGVVNLYLEEIVLTTDNRVRCIFAVRDPALGTYTVQLLDSVLYPFVLPAEDAIRPAHPIMRNTSTLIRALLSAGPSPFGVVDVSEDAAFDVEAVRPGHPALLVTSALVVPLILITDVSSPARLFVEDALRPAHPTLLVTSTLEAPIILITGVSSPARLFVEDAFRPTHPLLLGSSVLFDPLIIVDQSSAARLPPEDAIRPAHPLLLNTSTLV